MSTTSSDTENRLDAENRLGNEHRSVTAPERATVPAVDSRGPTARPAYPAAGDPLLASRAVGPSVPPAGIGMVGVMTVLVGAWGGIVPFVGPTFGFSADGSGSWYWSLPHALLWMVPGAVAVFCGLVMLGLVPRAFAGLARLGSWVTGLLTVCCGAWFVVGVFAWPVLRNAGTVFQHASAIREFSYWIGYSLGPGLLLAMLGAFAMGWAVRSRRAISFPGAL
jgi:hypothetical protein